MVARRVRLWLAVILLLGTAPIRPPEAVAADPARTVLILPYAATELPPQERWLGEAVTHILSLALAPLPAFVQVDPKRLARLVRPPAWAESTSLDAARSLKADIALFGEIQRVSGDVLVFQPSYLESHNGSRKRRDLGALAVRQETLLEQLGALPLAYVRALGIPLSDAEVARIGKAARPTLSRSALEAYVKGREAALEGTQEGTATAADLLARAVELDYNFAPAQYYLGVVHQALGNRWKAAAQFRASIHLDKTYPEPWKSLGDLFLTTPRRLFDQAVEAYQKAVALRPFYADAYVGLGNAKAARGDVDGAVEAYNQALRYDPANPKVYVSLGKIYYAEKDLYYEAVAAYKQAIELDAEFLGARMGLGELYEEKGLYQDAIAQYGKVIELESDHTGALYNLAVAYEKVDPREAVARWEHYIDVASHLPAEKDWVDVARQHLKKLKAQFRKDR
ncbi:MAG: tetratricopeptide repeat protein [Candidatus Methylomirabilia bacterium]